MKPEGKRRAPRDWTFLVVDNDAQVRQVLQEYLQTLGYRHVLTAKNGREAMTIIQNPLQRLDVIMSDFEMPQMNGMDLLKTLKKLRNRTHVAFIMITSESSLERMKVTQAIFNHVDHYILKPFRKAVLKQKIDEVIEKVNSATTPQKTEDQETERTKTKVIVEESTATGTIKQKNEDEGAALFGQLFAKMQEQGGLGKVLVNQAAKKSESGDVSEQVNISSMLKLAKVYKTVDWFDKPIHIFSEATKVLPDFAEVWFYLGVSHYYRGNINEALASFAAVIKIDPKHKEAIEYILEIKNAKKAG